MDNTQELIERLKDYNEWRRGAETEQPSPDQLGKDLDSVIAILSEYEEMARLMLVVDKVGIFLGIDEHKKAISIAKNLGYNNEHTNDSRE